MSSCQWSKNIQDEIKNIKTNSLQDIKTKRKKIKEIQNHWCTLENGKIGVNCCQNNNPPECRTGCDCRNYKHCEWSLNGVQLLGMLNKTQSLYIVTSRKFRENICSMPEKKVCCCGVRQVSNSRINCISNFQKNILTVIVNPCNDNIGCQVFKRGIQN